MLHDDLNDDLQVLAFSISPMQADMHSEIKTNTYTGLKGIGVDDHRLDVVDVLVMFKTLSVRVR